MILRLRGVAFLGGQFEAYQPRGNGTNGQTVWLSFATFGSVGTKISTSGAGGVDGTARRRHAHCKFIVVAPASKCFSNSVSVQIRWSVQNRHARKNGALILKSRMQSRKNGVAFQPVAQPCPGTSKVDRLG